MGTDRLKRALLCLGLAFCLGLAPPAARAASGPEGQAPAGSLPGQESWQPYLDQAPADLEDFVSDPLGTVRALLPGDLAGTMQASVAGYARVLLYLLLVLLISFFAGEGRAALLDLAAAGGSVLLCWAALAALAETVCEKLESWRLFLLGFVPVYEGVLIAGGEPTAGAAAGGLFLSGLCLLAQLLCSWTPPLFHCYLALSAACCISTEAALAAACRSAGNLFRRGLGWAGRAFAALLGLQRVFTAQMDQASQQLGQLLTGTVPIVGQSLSAAAGAVLSGMRLLKSGLGFAAIAFLAAEFLPLYMVLMVHTVLLLGCELLCSAAGLGRCAALFGCLRQGVQGLAAAIALVFGIAVLGTALLFMMGGG